MNSLSLQELSCIGDCSHKKETLKRFLYFGTSDKYSQKSKTFLVIPSRRGSEPETKLNKFVRDLFSVCWSYLLNQQEYIIFFEKPDFKGRLYFLPLRPFRYTDEAEPQKVFDQKIKDFIKQFRFYYRQTFSCVIPQRYQIVFTSYEKNESIFNIGEGVHTHLFFQLKYPIHTITLESKK